MRITLLIATATVSLGAAGLLGPDPGEAGGTAPAVTRPEPALSLDPHRLAAHLRGLADPVAVVAGMNTLTDAALQGDPAAQVALGRIYLQGLPAVPRDPIQARRWFARAQRSHHPDAAYFLGLMSQSGYGAAPDPAAAARWFAVAAEGGSADAMFRLANAFSAGAGVTRDAARAVALYERAGEQEHPGALQALAMAYRHGDLGLAPDEAEHRRYMLAAEHAITHLASDAAVTGSPRRPGDVVSSARGGDAR